MLQRLYSIHLTIRGEDYDKLWVSYMVYISYHVSNLHGFLHVRGVLLVAKRSVYVGMLYRNGFSKWQQTR